MTTATSVPYRVPPGDPRQRDEIAKLHGLLRGLGGDVRGLRAIALATLRALEPDDTAIDVKARQAGAHMERDR
jgi:hypothetical protein